MSERVRHIKHGTTYRVLGEASFHNASRRLTGEGDAITIYQSEEDGSLWARPSNEFRDGRFERIPSPSTSSAEATGGVAVPNEKVIIDALVSLAVLAWQLCDNTANSNPPEVDQADWDKLSAALDVLDALPDDQPGYTMGPAAKAEWALRRLLDAAPELPAATVQPAPDGWRDISTAPRDGTLVDLFFDECRLTDCYWGLPDHCCGEAGKYCDSEWHSLKPGWVDGIFNEPLEDEPSYWMPRPAWPLARIRSAIEPAPVIFATEECDACAGKGLMFDTFGEPALCRICGGAGTLQRIEPAPAEGGE